MKITVVLLSVCVGMSISGERGTKRVVESTAYTRDGFLAPGAAFKIQVDCGEFSPGNCTLAKWPIINLGKH